MQMQTEKILRLELPYRDTLDIQRTVFRGGSGPTAAVISGIHGDEIEGLYVCHQLAVWLNAHPEYLAGRVELYPAANPHGLTNIERFVPVFESDLNRNFPGHADGLVPQRMAEAIFRSTKDAAVVMDIHAERFPAEIPQVRIKRAFVPRLVPLAQLMNLDLIWVHGSMTVMEATVSHSLNSVGTPCLVLEMGVGMRITPIFTQQIVTGILHVWRSLGVLSQEKPLEALTHDPALATDNNDQYLKAETSGIFIPAWSRRSVKAGDLLGLIVSPFHSKPLSEVHSPVNGFLFTVR